MMILDVSLGLILEEGMAARLARHEKLAGAFRAAWRALGLKALPATEALTAHSLSAIFYPPGIDMSLVKAVAGQGVVMAGGLHPALKATYFRVGHMGAVSPNDVLAVGSAIERSLLKLGHKVEAGVAVTAAEKALA